VILGIVSSIGAEVIANVYESYIVQRAQYRANIKTELALNQIANRLRYALPETVGARKSALTDTFVRMEEVTDPQMHILQWVGIDGDSFEAIQSGSNRKPGWSGFADLNTTVTTTTNIKTPGSNLDLAGTIISNLGGAISSGRIYFSDGDALDGYPISSASGEDITLNSAIPSGDRITERYKLAWSSYALEVDNNGDLWLHYNFSPTRKTAINGSKSLLLQNVTNFRFKYGGEAFRIKICKKERISFDSNETVHACKERVVF